MNIGGFTTMTLLDFPEKIACSIFTRGCNFCCPYCQNSELVLNCPTVNEHQYDEAYILNYLKKRRNLLDGVCITGGEATLNKDLAEFIYKIKNLGYLVKLDTNGYKPNILQNLFEANLIDYVAMDFKAPYEKYQLAAGKANIDLTKIQESVDFLINSGINYEFRTTLVKGIHEKSDMEKMAKALKSANKYYLQSYRDSDNVIAKSLGHNIYSSFTKDELNEFLNIAKKHISNSFLRGVD